MKFALLIAGLGAAAGQCYTYADATSCNGNSTCAWNFACTPTNATYGYACGSDPANAATCTGPNNCGAGAAIMNPATCSKCTNLCATKTDNTTCSNQAGCTGVAFCYDKPMAQSVVCGGTSSTTCTNEAGCFWIGFTVNNACNGPFSGLAMSMMMTNGGMCAPCNSTAGAVRASISRLVGNTCTFVKTGIYTANVTVTLNALSPGKVDANCPAITTLPPSAALMSADVTALAAGLALGTGLIDGTSPAVCMKAASPSGVSMLSPSLALLGLAAFLTRL